MVDRVFRDVELAALYERLNPWGPGDDFYLELVTAAGSVLDLGCGTGRLLRAARAAGHRGRLTGMDPAAAMLVQARRAEPDIEWVLGDFATHRWEGAFDLVVMTGHAFQELLGDGQVRGTLRGACRALADGGRFVFETRNPAARAWERWTPDRVHEFTDGDGAPVRVWHEAEPDLVGDRMTFTETYAGTRWEQPQVCRSTLRFLDADALDGFLGEAGLAVAERYGDWGRRPMAPAPSPEIITVATAADQSSEACSSSDLSAGSRTTSSSR
ncbi:class I SAM-dependent methyltransferase [Streptomyces sp. NPDC101165]|uniref:class I SAM-dependent methyltransferase n=1 Tax=Streptomyces sp. NPDC101165 TaxID=3366119 RepID=UPI0038089C4D